MKVGDKVICVDNELREDQLTLGKEYTIAATLSLPSLINDKGLHVQYFNSRFMTLPNWLRKKEVVSAII